MLVAADGIVGNSKIKYTWDDYYWGDYGLTFGAGLKFKRFGVDSRYQMGLGGFSQYLGYFSNEAILVGGSIYF